MTAPRSEASAIIGRACSRAASTDVATGGDASAILMESSLAPESGRHLAPAPREGDFDLQRLAPCPTSLLLTEQANALLAHSVQSQKLLVASREELLDRVVAVVEKGTFGRRRDLEAEHVLLLLCH